jgi:hypothetical protein
MFVDYLRNVFRGGGFRGKLQKKVRTRISRPTFRN